MTVIFRNEITSLYVRLLSAITCVIPASGPHCSILFAPHSKALLIRSLRALLTSSFGRKTATQPSVLLPKLSRIPNLDYVQKPKPRNICCDSGNRSRLFARFLLRWPFGIAVGVFVEGAVPSSGMLTRNSRLRVRRMDFDGNGVSLTTLTSSVKGDVDTTGAETVLPNLTGCGVSAVTSGSTGTVGVFEFSRNVANSQSVVAESSLSYKRWKKAFFFCRSPSMYYRFGLCAFVEGAEL